MDSRWLRACGFYTTYIYGHAGTLEEFPVGHSRVQGSDIASLWAHKALDI